MGKVGRPKKTNKASNRVHSIVLTEKAEYTFRFIVDKQGTKWFSGWISKKLCDEFPIDNQEKFWLQEMRRREREMHDKQDLFQEAKEKYLKLKNLSPESKTKAAKPKPKEIKEL